MSYSAETEERLELELLDSYLSSIKKFLEGKISKGGLFFEYIELQNWHEQIHDQLEENLVILSPQIVFYLTRFLLGVLTSKILVFLIVSLKIETKTIILSSLAQLSTHPLNIESGIRH